VATIPIGELARVNDEELEFVFSRSSGPGGQHVNRVETRVTLRFDVDRSPSLGAEQKRRLHATLASRIGRDGVLRVVAQRHRSREANRRAAIERFVELVAAALRPRRPRRATHVPTAERRRRVESKRRRAELKRGRGRPGAAED
jgi:ribosome-associated protein